MDTDQDLPARMAIETVKPRKVYTWTCQYCGQPFETEIYSQRYCKPAHKMAAYRERRRS
jgi:hypothetical protein